MDKVTKHAFFYARYDPVLIAAFSSGYNDPSARFRIRQHIEPLHVAGIHVTEYIPFLDKHAGVPSKISTRVPKGLMPVIELLWRNTKNLARLPGLVGQFKADIIWLNRELLPGHYNLERFLYRPFILDVDDAVWRAKPYGVETMSRLARESALVITGNQYLANWFSNYSPNVRILPTAIDTDRFFLIKDIDQEPMQRFTVGWTGSSGNFGYLQAIIKPLNAFLQKYNDSRLLIVAEHPPQLEGIDTSRIEYHRWNPEIESSSLRKMNVGLMPLPDNEWTRGKCSFKMLQYMSTGIPVVVSPVGMNADVLSLGTIGFGATNDTEWFDALCILYENRKLAIQMGQEGHRAVIKRFSRSVVSEQLIEIFRSLERS